MTVILLARNRKDYEEMPENARKSPRFRWAGRAEDVIEDALDPVVQPAASTAA